MLTAMRERHATKIGNVRQSAARSVIEMVRLLVHIVARSDFN
jgi:hypothetical protein